MSEICREVVDQESGRECRELAEFILWGKLFPPEALGPRCRVHAIDHTSIWMPDRADQYAIYDLRGPIAKRKTRGRSW